MTGVQTCALPILLEFFLLWVGFAIVVGVVASNKGRSGFGWFVLALLISPLLAGLIVLAMQRNGMTAHDQMLFDAMPEEQQQRVLQARALRGASASSINRAPSNLDKNTADFLGGLICLICIGAAATWLWH